MDPNSHIGNENIRPLLIKSEIKGCQHIIVTTDIPMDFHFHQEITLSKTQQAEILLKQKNSGRKIVIA